MIAYLDQRLLFPGTNLLSTGRRLVPIGYGGKGTDQDRFLMLLLFKDAGYGIESLAKTKYALMLASICEVYKHITRLTFINSYLHTMFSQWLVARNGTAEFLLPSPDR